MASQVVELGSTPSGATNLAETAWVDGLSSEISVNQGRYRPFYGGCRIVASTLACEADGAGSIPVNHPNLWFCQCCRTHIGISKGY